MTSHPLERRWGVGGKPLPRRWAPKPDLVGEDHPTSAFDYTLHLRRLISDIVGRCRTFSHIDLKQTLITIIPNRTQEKHGLQARVTPMRFRDGRLYRQHRGKVYQVQRYFHDNREQLYLVGFSLPRFHDLGFEEKLITVFHELYHIGPNFDGDLRRHGGRYEFHTHSEKEYDRQMAELAREYLRRHDAPEVHEFLHPTYAQLWKTHGGIFGTVIPRPKIVPVKPELP